MFVYKVSLLSNLLGLLVALEEVLLPALAVILDQLWVEVGGVDGPAVVSPGGNISIGNG